MLRSSSRIFNNVVSVGSLELDYNIQNSVIQQFVRWRINSPWRIRKPVHLGTAKTKVFRIPVKPVISEAEKEELKYLHYNYKTYMRSIYGFLKEENLKMADGSKQLQEEEEREYLHFLECMKENDRWNEECAKVRDARLAEKRLEMEMFILQRQRVSKIEAEERALEWETQVHQQMELAKDFITEETLDEAVRNAMENFVDFNFAITLKGEKIMGKAPMPDEELKSSQSAQAEASA